MNKPPELLASSRTASESEAEDASRFAACCAVASCARPTVSAVGGDRAGAEPLSPDSAPDRARQLADLSLIACMAAAKVRGDATARGCQIRLDLPSDALLVVAAPAQLEAAVINLMSAALDAGATALVLSAHAEGKSIRVQLEDNRGSTGAGTSAPLAAMVPESCSAEELARSIARRIVEDHGGEFVTVHDARRGVLVSLTLPRHSEDGASP